MDTIKKGTQEDPASIPVHAHRVGLAWALINDPAVIIADEPTAHLDSRLSEDFMHLLGQFKAAGKTLLITSHDPIVNGSPLPDLVVEMRDGRIVNHA